MAGAFKASIKVEGAREVLAMLKGLDPTMQDLLRTESGVVGQVLIGDLKVSAGRSRNPQAKLLEQTLKVTKDRVPKVQAGGPMIVAKGSKKAGSKKAAAIVLATEFGVGTGTHGFQPHRGRSGYWFLPTVDSDAEKVAQLWRDAVGKVLLAANDATPGVSSHGG